MLKKKKYIFITGNNTHGGKGLIGSSLGYLLESIGLKAKLLKIANYLNQKTDTLNPANKGEVWITESGKATSMDCGDYCHILGYEPKGNFFTSLGILLQNILNKERDKVYREDTLMLHSKLAEELKIFINGDENDDHTSDFTIVEIGGNLSEYETNLIVNSSLQLMDQDSFYHINVGSIPKINDEYNLDLLHTIYSKIIPHNLRINHVILREPDDKIIKSIEIPNVEHISNIEPRESIYEIPILLDKDKILDRILKHFKMTDYNHSHKNLDFFHKIHEVLSNEKLPVIKVAILGKDGANKKAYHSVFDALTKAGVQLNKRVQITIFDLSLPSEHLKEYNCLVFTGGSGPIFTENIIQHLRHARQNNIPTLMICLSYQLALIEIARHVIGIKDATSLEFSHTGTHIICLMDKNLQPKIHNNNGTEYERLGIYPIYLDSTSIMYPLYKAWTNPEDKNIFKEKFRHRYWFNHNFRHVFEGSYGIHFSFTDVKNIGIYGFELDEKLHKFYVGVKFHPENSTIQHYHPLFLALLSKTNI